jgi:hypothetical protein
MPRYFWISASIAVLIAAFALLALALPGLHELDGASLSPASRESAAQQQVATYPVPPARAEAIRNTLNSVLLANRDGAQPYGQASLPMPDRLVVSAPGRMQPSIRNAIVSLSQGEAAAATSDASATIDIWLVDAVNVVGKDDPQLAPIKAVLEQARQRFGHGHYRLLERSMAVASLGGGSVAVTGPNSRAQLHVLPREAGTVEAQIELQLVEAGRVSNFQSKMLLPEGEWQLVGLLPPSRGDAPERLLLLRQSTVTAAVNPAAAAGQ